MVDTFSWDQELRKNAPTLLKLLYLLVSQSDNRNKVKKGDKHNPGVCMAVGLLLKERNMAMSGLQTVSAFLF